MRQHKATMGKGLVSKVVLVVVPIGVSIVFFRGLSDEQ